MYPLSPLFAFFCVWFVSRDVTVTSFPWPSNAIHINLPKLICLRVYQNSFGIVYIGTVYVFLVSHYCTWKKTKQNKTTTTTTKNSNKTSKLNFFWENLGIDQVSNVVNKETKVRSTGLLFGFYHHNYLQDIIQTFSRAKFFFK